MAARVLRVSGAVGEQLRAEIAAIWSEQGVSPDFPTEVEEAASAAAKAPRMPDLDRTDLEFVTLDPETSLDLDQAMHLARDGAGFVVHYAIADLAAFITPGDALDVESHRRGESLYGADSKIPLHPKVLSEGAASLLPGQVTPAFVWTIALDATGEVVSAKVERARVRSRAKLDYEGAQRDLDAGTAGETVQLLKVVGTLRVAKEAERGGVNLPMPEQEIHIDGDQWSLAFRTMLPLETWNAQISLLTGFAAASIMLKGKVGILRTLPPPPPDAVRRLRHQASALGITWPETQEYPEFVRGLDPAQPAQAAMLVACTALLRGAGYAGFDGVVPEQPLHAALASSYAHVTAPLRRLVDRYGLETCAALCAGQPVPDWVRSRLQELPMTMQDSTRRAHAYENAILDLVEAHVLAGRVGQQFDAVVLGSEHDDKRSGSLMVSEPAVEAKVTSGSDLPVGQQVRATLTEADPATRRVRFELC